MNPERAPSLVSIIIPCFNNDRYVGEAIDSALRQTYPRVEVIVIDDGSTDGSAAVIGSFGEQIRCERTPNRGVSAARNRGIAMARGEFVQFLDADDLLLPDKVAACMRGFSEGTDVVFAGRRYFTDPGEEPKVFARLGRIVRNIAGFPGRTPSIRWDPSDPLEYLLRASIGVPVPLHKVESLRNVGGFNEDLRNNEDVELHVRLALAGNRFSRIAPVLVLCRHHSSPSRARYDPRASLEALKAAHVMYAEIARANRLSKGVRRALADRLANYGRKAFWAGAKGKAMQAFRVAYRLHRHPRPTGVPVYNLVSNVLGLEQTEQVFSCLHDMLRGKGTQ